MKKVSLANKIDKMLGGANKSPDRVGEELSTEDLSKIAGAFSDTTQGIYDARDQSDTFNNDNNGGNFIKASWTKTI